MLVAAIMTISKDTVASRRHVLDNLRSFLTGLVVMHHTGAAYGGAGMGGLFKSGLFPAEFVSLPLWQFDVASEPADERVMSCLSLTTE
jgi:hypothetical protein